MSKRTFKVWAITYKLARTRHIEFEEGAAIRFAAGYYGPDADVIPAELTYHFPPKPAGRKVSKKPRNRAKG